MVGKIIPVTQITDNIYLGTTEDAENIESLREEGVNAIVNVAFEKNLVTPIHYYKVGISYLDINTQRVWIAAAATLAEAIDQNNKVLICCQKGAQRSPLVLALYFALKNFSNLDTEIEKLAELRPQVDPFDRDIKMCKLIVAMKPRGVV